MSGPPLTPDQADLLAAYGTWKVSWLLTDPGEAVSHVKGMGSCRMSDEWSWRTDGHGITAARGRYADPAPEVVVSWRLIRSCAHAVPGHLLAGLRAARARAQVELQRTVAPYCPGGYAPFVQPPPAWRRAAEDDEREALEACLDSLTLADPAQVAGQLDLFGAA